MGNRKPSPTACLRHFECGRRGFANRSKRRSDTGNKPAFGLQANDCLGDNRGPELAGPSRCSWMDLGRSKVRHSSRSGVDQRVRRVVRNGHVSRTRLNMTLSVRLTRACSRRTEQINEGIHFHLLLDQLQALARVFTRVIETSEQLARLRSCAPASPGLTKP